MKYFGRWFVLGLCLPIFALAAPSKPDSTNPFGVSVESPEALQSALSKARAQAEATAEPLLKSYVGGSTENDRVRAVRFFYANLSQCKVGNYRFATPTLLGGLPSDSGEPLPLYYFHIAKVLGTEKSQCIYVDGFMNESQQSVVKKCAIPENDLHAFSNGEAVATAKGGQHFPYFNKVMADNCTTYIEGRQLPMGNLNG